MTIENCPECGGTHIGSNECPFPAAKRRAAAWKPDVVLYHGHCTDGFAAAWACWKRWGDACAYVPMQYGDALPDIAGKHVLMVDFSLKRNAMLEASKAAKSLVVLDHHKSAKDELSDWDIGPDGTDRPMMAEDIAGELFLIEGEKGNPIIAHFDMDKSGCRLAWKFCHPDKSMPRLLEHIEDRDLWRFKLAYTKEVSAALRSRELSFALLDKFEGRTTGFTPLWSLISEGAAILRAQDKHVADFLEQAYMAEVAGYTVPVLNVPYAYASDCGHALLKKYPEAPFAATWLRRADGKIAWSLRSEDSREDVSKIAEKYGGGGHRNSSGFNSDGAAFWSRPPAVFQCGARRSGSFQVPGGGDPQECDWPTCGCDDYAMKVIEALEESGFLKDRGVQP